MCRAAACEGMADRRNAHGTVLTVLQGSATVRPVNTALPRCEDTTLSSAVWGSSDTLVLRGARRDARAGGGGWRIRLIPRQDSGPRQTRREHHVRGCMRQFCPATAAFSQCGSALPRHGTTKLPQVDPAAGTHARRSGHLNARDVSLRCHANDTRQYQHKHLCCVHGRLLRSTQVGLLQLEQSCSPAQMHASTTTCQAYGC